MRQKKIQQKYSYDRMLTSSKIQSSAEKLEDNLVSIQCLLPGYRQVSESSMEAILELGSNYGLLHPFPISMNYSTEELLSMPKRGITYTVSNKWACVEAKRKVRRQQQEKELSEKILCQEQFHVVVNKNITHDDTDNEEEQQTSLEEKNKNKYDRKRNVKSNVVDIDTKEEKDKYKPCTTEDEEQCTNEEILQKDLCSNVIIPYILPEPLSSLYPATQLLISSVSKNQMCNGERCSNCRKRFVRGGVLVDAKSNTDKDYLNSLYGYKHFQVAQGYKMIEKEHITAILDNGREFGLTFPIPTKLNPSIITESVLSYIQLAKDRPHRRQEH